MTNDHLLYEKIDLYLKNALPKEEQLAFSIEINKDVTLEELVNTQRIAHKIVYTQQLIKLQSKIKADLDKHQNGYGFRSLLLIGLGIILTVGLINYFIDFSTKPVTNIPSIVQNDKVPDKNFSGPSNEIKPNSINKISIEPSKKNITAIPVETDSNVTEKIKEEKKIDNPVTTNLSIDPAPESTNKEIPVKTDCHLLNIDLAINISSACEGEQNGKIIINDSKIKGGKSPFSFSLHGKNNFSEKNEFHYLNAGSYTIYVLDAHQCMITKNIEIEEKSCKKSKVFAFTPELEKWKIPVQENKQGILKIFNKSGILVYTSEISSHQENVWDGTSSEGHVLETGYFTYKISYSDGEEEIGSVSIMRR